MHKIEGNIFYNSDRGITLDVSSVSSCKFEDNFISPEVWTEKDKAAYREWLSRRSNDHPSKQNTEPWNNPPPYFDTTRKR